MAESPTRRNALMARAYVAMMQADGVVSPGERRLYESIIACIRLEASDQALLSRQLATHEPLDEAYYRELRSLSIDDRKELIRNCVDILKEDGVFSPGERRLMVRLCAAVGYSSEEAEREIARISLALSPRPRP